MGMTIIDALVVTFGLDPTDHAKGRKAIEDDQKKLRETSDKTSKTLQADNKKSGESVKQLRGELLLLFAAFTAGKGLKEFVGDIATGDAQMGRFAKTLGMSVEELSKWRNLADLTGGSADGMQGSIQGLVDQFQQFQITGESSIIPYLRALGISISDLETGKMRPMRDILLDLADKFKGMDPSRAAALGKNLGLDPATINTLLLGREALKQLLDEQERMGITTQENAAVGAELQKNWAELKQTSMSLGRTLLTIFAPALNVILKLLKWVAEFLLEHKALLVGVFTAITIAVLALSAALIGSFVSTAVGAAVAGFGLISGAAVDLMVFLGALTETVLPALAEAFIAVGLAIEATPIGWIITGIAALAAVAYFLYENWHKIASWWHHLWGGMADDTEDGMDRINGAASTGPGGEKLTGNQSTGPDNDAFARDGAGDDGRPKGQQAPGHERVNPKSGLGFLNDMRSTKEDVASLMKMGWTREQAFGIMANVHRESGGNARAGGDNGQAYGLAQWHRDRQANFAKWAGHDIRQSTHDEQIAFINYELRHGTEQRAGRALSGARTPGDAAAIVSRTYERPADVAGEARRRAEVATMMAGSGWRPPNPTAIANRGAGNRTSQSTSSSETRINTVNVYANNAKDGHQIGRAFKDEVETHSFTSQANHGAA